MTEDGKIIYSKKGYENLKNQLDNKSIMKNNNKIINDFYIQRPTKTGFTIIIKPVI